MRDPQPDFQPEPGIAEWLAPGLRRVLAPNPSPMTFRGTNTYLIGDGDLAIIDPGPSDENHLNALMQSIGTERVSAILVTHAHVDHSPLARALADRLNAPIYAFSDATGGRSAVMQQLAATGLMGGGEGVDRDFQPDIQLTDGETVSGDGWTLRALHTPGHFGNHLSFAWDDVLFCGDLVMGWASSLVSPPDGDLTDFMASCRCLRARADRIYLPGHGAPVTDPASRIDWLITHRKAREAAIIEALQAAPATAETLALQIYTETPAMLLPAAARNVFAHLVDLTGKNIIAPEGQLSWTARFHQL